MQGKSGGERGFRNTHTQKLPSIFAYFIGCQVCKEEEKSVSNEKKWKKHTLQKTYAKNSNRQYNRQNQARKTRNATNVSKKSNKTHNKILQMLQSNATKLLNTIKGEKNKQKVHTTTQLARNKCNIKFWGKKHKAYDAEMVL